MRCFVAMVAIGALAGCATVASPLREHLESPAPSVRACGSWYAALDQAIDAAAVRDAQEARIAGFPYLRANRLLSALKERAADSESAVQALAVRLAALDHAARIAEIGNLPEADVAGLPELVVSGSRAEALSRTRDCARLLKEIDMAKPHVRRMLLERARVPDDYSSGLRLAGLYFLTRIPFASGVRRWEDEMKAVFARAEDDTRRPAVRYAPPPAPRPAGPPGRPLVPAAENPLGMPEPQADDLADLIAAHAPSFEIEIGGDHDRFGELRWLRERDVPAVDASRHVVYAQASHTLYRGRVLLQLVYTLWFPERPPREPGDLLAGTLDAVMWRVTLSPQGEPLIYDTIHACGCFHMFFPTARARALAAPDRLEEWAFVPQQLPRVSAGERPLVRIASGTHYVERVALVRGTDSVARYQLRDYDELRSLMRLDGGSRSAFRPDGMIAGTERAERYWFWPMGVRSAGAMRQWGRHATAFVGRRHFDDADLFERRFEFDLR
ncbi:MAG TPA: hypothetical protein VFX67_12325 [Burkholderiales bacterium]|nr:hypothetical protein [Burkholderiales bacterium]